MHTTTAWAHPDVATYATALTPDIVVKICSRMPTVYKPVAPLYTTILASLHTTTAICWCTIHEQFKSKTGLLQWLTKPSLPQSCKPTTTSANTYIRNHPVVAKDRPLNGLNSFNKELRNQQHILVCCVNTSAPYTIRLLPTANPSDLATSAPSTNKTTLTAIPSHPVLPCDSAPVSVARRLDNRLISCLRWLALESNTRGGSLLPL